MYYVVVKSIVLLRKKQNVSYFQGCSNKVVGVFDEESRLFIGVRTLSGCYMFQMEMKKSQGSSCVHLAEIIIFPVTAVAMDLSNTSINIDYLQM